MILALTGSDIRYPSHQINIKDGKCTENSSKLFFPEEKKLLVGYHILQENVKINWSDVIKPTLGSSVNNWFFY